MSVLNLMVLIFLGVPSIIRQPADYRGRYGRQRGYQRGWYRRPPGGDGLAPIAYAACTPAQIQRTVCFPSGTLVAVIHLSELL